MKHGEGMMMNKAVADRVRQIIEAHGRPRTIPSYRKVTSLLNSEGYKTSRGNLWTPRRLFRMLQREGYSGLYGLLNNVGPAHSRLPRF